MKFLPQEKLRHWLRHLLRHWLGSLYLWFSCYWLSGKETCSSLPTVPTVRRVPCPILQTSGAWLPAPLEVPAEVLHFLLDPQLVVAGCDESHSPTSR